MKKVRKKAKSKFSPLATGCGIEIRAKGLTEKETELINAEFGRVLGRIRYERKKHGFSSLSYLIELK